MRLGSDSCALTMSGLPEGVGPVTSARSRKRRSVQQSFVSDYANPASCKLPPVRSLSREGLGWIKNIVVGAERVGMDRADDADGADANAAFRFG
jgi:hypothetical protein